VRHLGDYGGPRQMSALDPISARKEATVPAGLHQQPRGVTWRLYCDRLDLATALATKANRSLCATWLRRRCLGTHPGSGTLRASGRGRDGG
jgi:hypothetical protein